MNRLSRRVPKQQAAGLFVAAAAMGTSEGEYDVPFERAAGEGRSNRSSQQER